MSSTNYTAMQSKAQSNSTGKWCLFFIICVVIGVIVLVIFLVAGNGTDAKKKSECKWDDVLDCSTDFISVGGYCNPYAVEIEAVEFSVECGEQIYDLGKDCYKAFKTCKKVVGEDFGYQPYDHHDTNYCPCDNPDCC
eukprot:81354_1